MRIGIIEFEKMYSEQLTSFLKKWASDTHYTLSLKLFSDPCSLNYMALSNFDIIFITTASVGFSVAQKIRTSRQYGEIIFLAKSGDHIPIDPSTHCINYLLKPLTYNQVASFLTSFVKQINTDKYIYQYRDRLINIPYSDILYFASANHQTEIITCTDIYKQANTLKNISQLLPKQFCQCHRTAIINLIHAKVLSSQEIILTNNIRLPVSATYKEKLKKAFIAFSSSHI